MRVWKELGGFEIEGWEDEGTEVVLSVSAPTVSSLDDRPISKSLDLTSQTSLAKTETNSMTDATKGTNQPKSKLNYYS